MRRIAVVVGLILPLFAGQLCAATASKEPSEFRKIPFGASRATAERLAPGLDCSNSSGKVESTCNMSFKIGTASVDAEFYFSANKFVGARLQFDPSDYEYLRAAFVEKYGAPDSTTHPLKQNRLGATFADEELTWIFGQSTFVNINRYSTDSAEKGVAIVAKQDWMLKRNQARKSSAKKAAGDF